MTFKEQAEAVSPNLAGIYLITNMVNNKHYVGQSIYLRKRLLKHRTLWLGKRYDAPLYRAFTKYGIDNFKIELLWTTDSTEYNNIKRTLDIKERQYIQEYHSYGEYNQTLGGDAGVLGFKMGKEMKENTARNSKYHLHPIYAIDTITNEIIMAINISALLSILNLSSGCRTIVSKTKNCPLPKLYKNRYIIGETEQECKEKCAQLGQQPKRFYSCGEYKYTIDYILQILDKYKQTTLSAKQIAKLENLNDKTLYTYIHRMIDKGIEVPIKLPRIQIL